jgi:hypothetical protein
MRLSRPIERSGVWREVSLALGIGLLVAAIAKAPKFDLDVKVQLGPANRGLRRVELTLTNRTQGFLSIQEISATCDCLKIDDSIGIRTMAPGESSSVNGVLGPVPQGVVPQVHVRLATSGEVIRVLVK